MPNACHDAARMARQIARYLSSCQQDLDAGRPVVLRDRTIAMAPKLLEAVERAVEELGG